MKEPLLAKILRWLIYGSAFLPLVIFSQYISPFHFGKVIVFRSIVEIMFVLYLLLVWSDRSYRPRTSPVFWAFLGFAGAFTIATITSIVPYMSFWGTLERMGGLWSFWHYFAFFMILTAVFRKEEDWIRFLDLTIVTAVLSAFYGFGQKTDISFFIGSGGRERIFGTIGNAALFAGYEILSVFLTATLFLRPHQTEPRKIFYAVAGFFTTLAVIMTVVRGSLLGLGVGVVVFVGMYYMRFRARTAKLILITLTAGAVLGGFILITPIKNTSFVKESRFLSRLTDTSLDTYTAQTRFWTWEAGLKGWRDSAKTVLVGWGPENFNIPFSKYFNPKFFNGLGAETLFDRAHNMFIEILVTMGLLGLVMYLGIFVTTFRVLNRFGKDHPEESIYRIGFTSLVIAYIIHNSFIFDTSANFLVFFSMLGFISYLSVRHQPLSVPQVSRVSQPLRWAVGIMLGIGASVLMYQTNVVSTKANYATTRAIIAGWSNNFPRTIAKFQESIAYHTPGKYEYRHRLAQYLMEYAVTEPEFTSEVVNAFTVGITEVQKNADENPPDYLPELYLSRLNVVLAQGDEKSVYNDEALKHSLRALEISPTFIRTYYEIAQAYLNKKEISKAMEYFQRAIELNPEVGVSYWYLGISQLGEGQTSPGIFNVDEALAKGYRPSKNDYFHLLATYIKLNDYPHIVMAYEGLIKIEPTNAQYFASLATAYARVNRFDDALDAARQSVLLDPSFLPDAQAFARSIGRSL